MPRKEALEGSDDRLCVAFRNIKDNDMSCREKDLGNLSICAVNAHPKLFPSCSSASVVQRKHVEWERILFISCQADYCATPRPCDPRIRAAEEIGRASCRERVQIL